MWYNVLHTRNMWYNTLWYNNHMRCNSVWYTIIRYVTGVLYIMLYNMLCVLFTPLATIFWGSDIPAAQQPPASLSFGLVWMNITMHCSCSLQVITSSWWLGNLKEVTGLSVQEARDGRCMSAWAVCRTSEDPEDSHWPGQTFESMTTTVCQWPWSESKVRVQKLAKKLRIKN